MQAFSKRVSPAEYTALRAADALAHPGLPTLFGDLSPKGPDGTVEMVRVGDVDLDTHLSGRGPLDLPTTAATLEPVAAALAQLHDAGWYHGDVSLANVVLGPEGGVLVDFGSAGRSTAPGPVAQTPGFIAPEVLAGGVPSAASDVWSLAAVAVCCLTGQPAAMPLPVLPDPARHVLGRALAANPDLRPSARALAGSLARLGSTPALARPGGAPTVGRANRRTVEFGPQPPWSAGPGYRSGVGGL